MIIANLKEALDMANAENAELKVQIMRLQVLLNQKKCPHTRSTSYHIQTKVKTCHECGKVGGF